VRQRGRGRERGARDRAPRRAARVAERRQVGLQAVVAAQHALPRPRVRHPALKAGRRRARVGEEVGRRAVGAPRLHRRRPGHGGRLLGGRGACSCARAWRASERGRYRRGRRRRLRPARQRLHACLGATCSHVGGGQREGSATPESVMDRPTQQQPGGGVSRGATNSEKCQQAQRQGLTVCLCAWAGCMTRRTQRLPAALDKAR
jgi:hypothetical protein